MPTREELKSLQALPLEHKIIITQMRIREFIAHYGEDNVCVSFSGGKDSTVLLHIIREMYPTIKAVFFDTGLEYPEIRNFVKTFDNVDFVRPKMTFAEIVTKYGYPLFSKEVANIINCARINTGKTHTQRRKQLTGQYFTADGEKSMFNKEKYLECCKKLPFLISDRCCTVMKKSPSHKYCRMGGGWLSL